MQCCESKIVLEVRFFEGIGNFPPVKGRISVKRPYSRKVGCFAVL